MDLEQEKLKLLELKQTLDELRDSWMYISMALKDHMSETPSQERDEAMLHTQMLLAWFKKNDRGALE